MMRLSDPKAKRTGGAATFAAPFAAGMFVAATLGFAATTALAPARFARAQGPSLAPVPPPIYIRPADKGPKARQAFTVAGQPASTTPGTPNPMQTIMRMVRAGLSKPFLAREVTLSANGRETEQWVRWDPKRGMRIESIKPVSGDLLVDDFKQSWAFTQRDKKWISRNSLLPKVNGRIKDVLGRIADGELRTEWVGQEIVAGRAADIVRVFPADGAPGPSRKFWIDRQSGVRLKMEEVGPAGRTMNSSYLLSLDLSPHFGKEDFAPPAEAAVPAPLTAAVHEDRQQFHSLDEAIQANYSPRQPGYLPPGYALRVVEVVTRNGEPRITQRYANGLSVISIVQTMRMPFGRKVQEQLGPSQTGFVPLPRGDRAYVWRDPASGLYLALIGALPDDQTRKIAASVR